MISFMDRVSVRNSVWVSCRLRFRFSKNRFSFNL